MSTLAGDVARLRAAAATSKQESEQERRERLYRDAGDRLQLDITPYLIDSVRSTGLTQSGLDVKLEGWPPPDYGGSCSRPMWGIDGASYPVLATSVGVVHRVRPAEDLEDLAITFLIATVTAGRQHTYVNLLERFRPGSIRLDRILDLVRSEIDRLLPEVVADFLTLYKDTMFD